MRTLRTDAAITIVLLAMPQFLGCPADDATPALSEGETGAGDEGGETGGVGPSVDLKTVDASSCVTHPDSLFAEFELTIDGQYLNVTAPAAHVLCPIIRDRPNEDEPWEVRVVALDSSGSEDVSCMAVARDLQGNIVGQSPEGSTTGSSSASQTLALEVPQSEPFAYHYLDCMIPGEDPAGGHSGLASFLVAETKTFESVNQKSYPGMLGNSTNFFPIIEPDLTTVDHLGFAELYVPEENGLSFVSLPIVRDSPDEMVEGIRVHYYGEPDNNSPNGLNGGMICTFTAFDDAGLDVSFAVGDQALGGPFGTIDIVVPPMFVSDGPHFVSCTIVPPIAIVAYDVDEP